MVVNSEVLRRLLLAQYVLVLQLLLQLLPLLPVLLLLQQFAMMLQVGMIVRVIRSLVTGTVRNLTVYTMVINMQMEVSLPMMHVVFAVEAMCK